MPMFLITGAIGVTGTVGRAHTGLLACPSPPSILPTSPRRLPDADLP
jgi:hypothetical protein